MTGGGTLTVAFSSDYEPYGVYYAATGMERFMYTDKLYDSVIGRGGEVLRPDHGEVHHRGL